MTYPNTEYCVGEQVNFQIVLQYLLIYSFLNENFKAFFLGSQTFNNDLRNVLRPKARWSVGYTVKDIGGEYEIIGRPKIKVSNLKLKVELLNSHDMENFHK